MSFDFSSLGGLFSNLLPLIIGMLVVVLMIRFIGNIGSQIGL